MKVCLDVSKELVSKDVSSVTSFKVSQYKINLPVFMAPMVGLSHVVFRQLVRSYLPNDLQTLWPTEMLNSRRIPHERLGATPQTLKAENENDLAPQLLGNQKEEIEKSIHKLLLWGAKAIDINMGCPVQKALKHNYGVALMGDIDYAKQVTSYAVSSSDLPVSVKIRAGLQKDRDFLAKFVLSLQAAGASWICLHPRLAEQKRRGHADWSQIQFVKQILDIPVIGNGDVQTSEDALKMFLETKCDGVMIGRALTARPWLLAQIATQLGVSSQSHWLHVSLEEEAYKYGEALMKFINLSEQFFNEVDGLKRLRFYIKVSHPWLNFGHSLYANAHRVNTYDQAREMIVDFFRASGLKMHNYTELKY